MEHWTGEHQELVSEICSGFLFYPETGCRKILNTLYLKSSSRRIVRTISISMNSPAYTAYRFKMFKIGSRNLCKNCLNALYQQQRGVKRTSTVVRQSFIEFFCQKYDHRFIPSSPVIPKKNQGTYFTNAGMNQFKPIFLDMVDGNHPMTEYKRVVNSQKCVRVGGKHNDLDDVGKDLCHHTFFEMLGSWSFGDYFKEEACRMALELLTNVYNIPVSRLYFTYFGGDMTLGLKPDLETKDIWQNLSIPPDRILPFGMNDNFWDMGETGPCGPCTEIHYDHLETCNNSSLVNRGSENVIEIWNLVFMQYNRMSDGSLEPLHKVHVDTGMGLERILAVLNQSSSTYNTDLFLPLFHAIQKCSNTRAYLGTTTDDIDIAYRIVADHVRMASVCIADGLLPGSKSQGHKLQSVIFRCLHQSKKVLQMPNGSVPKLVDVVSQTLSDAFPEIENNRTKIKDVLLESEDHYIKAVEYGQKAFNRYLKKNPSITHLTDKVLLNIIDGVYSEGYSVPVQMIPDLSHMYNVNSDMDGLMSLLEKRHNDIKQTTTTDVMSISPETLKEIIHRGIKTTDDSMKYQYNRSITGRYTFAQGTVSTVACIVKDDNLFSEATEEDEFSLLLDRTIFYSEGGGQMADVGLIKSEKGVFKVRDVQLCKNYVLHIGEMVSGKISVGDTVTLVIDEDHRLGCMSNHTATHVLNGCLRKMYSNVRQEGSRVKPHKLTFDFSTTSQVKPDDLSELQNRVQQTIDKHLPVHRELISLEEAMAIPNIVSLVDEEYPSEVYTVAIGEDNHLFSTELCGGTHVKDTHDIECFCIVSASLQSQASKSITCVTGTAAEQAIEKGHKLEEDITELENLVKSKTEHETWLPKSKHINKVLGNEVLPKAMHDNIKLRIDMLGDPMKRVLNSVKKELLKQEVFRTLKNCSSNLCTVNSQINLSHQVIKQVLLEIKSSKPVAVISSNDSTPIVICAHQGCNLEDKMEEIVKKLDNKIKVKVAQKQGYTLLTISMKQISHGDSLTFCDQIQSVLS